MFVVDLGESMSLNLNGALEYKLEQRTIDKNSGDSIRKGLEGHNKDNKMDQGASRFLSRKTA